MSNQVKLNEAELKNLIREAINEEMQESYFTNLFKRGVNKAWDAGKQMAQRVKDDKAAYDAMSADEKAAMQQAKGGMKTAKQNRSDAETVSIEMQRAIPLDVRKLENMSKRYANYDKDIQGVIKNLSDRLSNILSQVNANASNAARDYRTAKQGYKTAKGNYRAARQNADANFNGVAAPANVNEAIDQVIDKVLFEIKNK